MMTIMMTISSILCIAVLCLQLAHYGHAMFSEYTLEGTVNNPKVVSSINGKKINLMPYYSKTGVKEHHSKGMFGRGVRIGIIGDGAFVRHEALSDPSRQDDITYVNLIAAVRQLPKDHIARQECTQRGTKLAGIIRASSSTFRGVAPKATLMVYRVAECMIKATTSVVLKALDMAVNSNNADIVILPETLKEDSFFEEKLRKAIQSAAAKGVIMLVAATKHNYSITLISRIADCRVEIPFMPSHWFEEISTRRRIKFTSICKNMDYDLDVVDIVPIHSSEKSIMNPRVAGKVIMITGKRLPTKDIKASFFKSKAVGLILTHTDYKRRSHCSKPIFIISKKEASDIKAEMRNKKYKHNYLFSGKYGNVKDNWHPMVSASGEQNRLLQPIVQPDILAPGVNLFTTVTNTKIGYDYISDPYAAVMYTAGVGGRRLGFDSARNKLKSGASPIQTFYGKYLVSPLYQGTGIVDVFQTINNQIIASPRAIHFNPSFGWKTTIHITSLSEFEQYSVMHIASPSIVTSLSDGVIIREINDNRIHHQVYYPNVVYTTTTSTKLDDGSIISCKAAEIDVSIILPQHVPPNEEWHYTGYIVINPISLDPMGFAQIAYIPYHASVKGSIANTA
ncbi:peptidase S8/S53 domain-containing protein [Syncephalis plumigaleata]|nr:peptidase S8/S53 domain-containing protein [Syncephalis plumigaleata]